MSIIILVLVAALMLVIMGYRFNRLDGKLEQGGLLQYDSRPNGADVYVDSARLANRTANKITISAGNHTIRMTKDGYNDWSKDVTIKAGAVLWLNYTRFVPKDKQIDTVATASSMTSAAVSGNQRLVAFKDDPATPSVSVASIDGDTPKVEKYDLASGSFTAPADAKNQAFSIDSWDGDARYLLIRHTYDGDKSEWLMLDTQGDKSTLNITTSMGVTIGSAEFVSGNSRALYILETNGELRRIDLGAKTISAPIITNVAEFYQYDRSTITYATKIDDTTKKRTIGYITNGASKARTLKTYADLGDTPLHLRIGHYFDKTYVAIAYGETLDITSGDLPSSDSTDVSKQVQVASVTIPGGVTKLAFSPDTQRFVSAETPTSITTYDLELNTLGSAKIENANGRGIQWVDREHFVSNTGEMALYDFDGTNRQVLTSGGLSLPVVITPNNKYMVVFTQDAHGAHLQRIKLLLN